MKTTAPWYWEDGVNDHDACGLVLGVGRSGLIHYVKAAHAIPSTACNSGAANFKEFEFHGQIVTCRNCCSIAKHNRHKIKMREVKPLISSASRTNFVYRERVRLAEGRAWRGRHRVKSNG